MCDWLGSSSAGTKAPKRWMWRCRIYRVSSEDLLPCFIHTGCHVLSSNTEHSYCDVSSLGETMTVLRRFNGQDPLDHSLLLVSQFRRNSSFHYSIQYSASAIQPATRQAGDVKQLKSSSPEFLQLLDPGKSGGNRTVFPWKPSVQIGLSVKSYVVPCNLD